MKRITKQSTPPFNYALIDEKDKEIGFFKDYDCFFSHQMAVKRIGEIEDAIENIEKIIAETKEDAAIYIDEFDQDLGWKEAYLEIKEVIANISRPVDRYNYWGLKDDEERKE